MMNRQILTESESSGFVRVPIRASTARPRPNIAVTKCKVAALFPPVGRDLLRLRPGFAMQSPQKHSHSFWVVIITGITTQKTLDTDREIESRVAASSNLGRKSVQIGLQEADCTENDAATLRLMRAMLGLGRVASLLTRAPTRRWVALVKAVSEAKKHDLAGGLLQ
jgi:hypothetical protein